MKHMKEVHTKPTASSRVFIVLAFLLLLAPFVLMPLFSADVTSEKRDLASFPEFTLEDGSPNWSYFSEFESWFNDHFALRSYMLEANAQIKAKLFKTSASDEVVLGNDDWLYYAGDINDYQGWNNMSDAALEDAVFNLSLIQEYLQKEGKHFVLTIAPNKMSLYPENIPYYEQTGEGATNLERLEELLAAQHINYVSLLEAFNSETDVLYLHRDSHWNNTGALRGYELLMEGLGYTPQRFEEADEADLTHVGDIDAMLFPLSAKGEAQSAYPSSQNYQYTGDAMSVDAGSVDTVATAPIESGSLLMMRDSFGDAILPFFASSYQKAHFSRLTPYDFGRVTIAAYDDVIIERVERHLSSFATTPPYMPAPLRYISVSAHAETNTTISCEDNGPYLVVEGEVDERLLRNVDDYHIYVLIESEGEAARAFEAFHVSGNAQAKAESAAESEALTQRPSTSDWGYRAYIEREELGDVQNAQISIVVTSNDEFVRVVSEEVSL